MTSVIRRPIGKTAGERLVAFAGLCRAVYFRLAAAGRLPCIDCTSQGAETCCVFAQQVGGRFLFGFQQVQVRKRPAVCAGLSW